MEQIEQNNRLIAEFDGWRYHSANANQIIETVDGVKHRATFNEHGVWENIELRKSRYVHNYDKNWSQLMPVVEKIESDFDPNIKNYVSINGHKCGIWNYWDVTEILREHERAEDRGRFKVQGKGETKIEAVYSAVVQFVKWYNKNKQP